MPSQKSSVHNFNKRSVAGKWKCEVGRQEVTENMYILWSNYTACTLVRFKLQMSVNISGVPFKIAKHRQDGRIVGGNSANIQDHPHQVNLLICC